MWTLEVISGKDFCSAVRPVGLVGNEFSLAFTTNNSEEERSADVRISFSDGYSNNFTIRQLPKTKDYFYDHTWAEQPEFMEGAPLVHKSYYTTLSNGKRVRNYSVCYDTEKLVSLWVAYPVHDIYTSGSTGRTEEWSFDDAYYFANGSNYTRKYIVTDPEIPQSKQQNIAEGGYQTNGLDRGHMLPSATRQSAYELNAQTYYATNMMPQASKFNQGIWGTLEGNVRGWRCADTLYVVVGTLFEGTPQYVNARGRKIQRPSHAYKIVMRTKSGRTGKHIANITSADELQCIGFLFSNDNEGANTSIKDAAISVSDIEKRSGVKFFRNLNPEIADEVKAQKNFSDWGL